MAGRPPADGFVAKKGMTVKLPPDLIAEAQAHAKKLGMTYTAFHEAAIRAALGGSIGQVAVPRPAGRAPVAVVVDPAQARAAAFRARGRA